MQYKLEVWMHIQSDGGSVEMQVIYNSVKIVFSGNGRLENFSKAELERKRRSQSFKGCGMMGSFRTCRTPDA